MRKIAVIQVLFIVLFLINCSAEKEETTDKGSVTEEQGAIPEEESGQESEEEKPEEGYSRAGFIFSGEYAEQKSASTKTELADLFALQFYDTETQQPYAFVLGDDINQIKVDFRTGHTYMLKITYIKNGQNIIYDYDGRWGSPFTNSGYITANLNQPYYSSDIFLNGISSPFIYLKDESGALYVETERFHGIIENFEITEENKDLSIDLQRLVFGISLNVELADSTLDTISFAIHSEYDSPKKYFITLQEGKGNLEIPFLSLGFPLEQDQGPKYLNTLDMAVLGEYQEDVHFSIGTKQNETLFFDDFVSVERNKMTVINMAQENTSDPSNGNFTINFGEGMLDEYINLFAQ